MHLFEWQSQVNVRGVELILHRVARGDLRCCVVKEVKNNTNVRQIINTFNCTVTYTVLNSVIWHAASDTVLQII